MPVVGPKTSHEVCHTLANAVPVRVPVAFRRRVESPSSIKLASLAGQTARTMDLCTVQVHVRLSSDGLSELLHTDAMMPASRHESGGHRLVSSRGLAIIPAVFLFARWVAIARWAHQPATRVPRKVRSTTYKSRIIRPFIDRVASISLKGLGLFALPDSALRAIPSSLLFHYHHARTKHSSSLR